MTPLSEAAAERLRTIDTLLFDIDDTFSSDGQIEEAAYSALWALKRAGFTLVPITGRPAGWADMIARMWPVNGVVGENGAFWFAMDHESSPPRMLRGWFDDRETRTRKRAQLRELATLILQFVPGAAVAADQAYRETDLAIDFCEDVAPLERDAIDEIARIFRQHGATAKISSIHVNGWFGDYDKLGMTRRFFKERLGRDLDSEVEQGRCAFAGDSPNDEPMFAFFANSVGVANFAAFADRVASPPKLITKAPAGKGFAELAAALLDR